MRTFRAVSRRVWRFWFCSLTMYFPGMGVPARGSRIGAGRAAAKTGNSERRRVSCMIAIAELSEVVEVRDGT